MLNPMGPPSRESRPDATPSQSTERLSDDPQRLRRSAATFALIAFLINFGLAQLSVNDARGDEASAVQIIQIWTPHIYYAVLITGIAVALYIYSRGKETV